VAEASEIMKENDRLLREGKGLEKEVQRLKGVLGEVEKREGEVVGRLSERIVQL